MMDTGFDMEKVLSVLKYDAQEPLLFNTGLFLVLFVAFLALYHLLRSRSRLRMLFVIAFSLYFYYKSSSWCCLILLAVCVSDYFLARWIHKSHKDWQARALVLVNVLMNVGMLVYFKYFNLIIDVFRQFVHAKIDFVNVVLPAGISFFTFRSISYVVDVYRKEMPPARNFIDYCFFLTFFPPLLAGPVVRAKDMMPQIASRPMATNPQIAHGFMLIMFGLIKKVIVADYLSANFVDRIFDNPSLYSGFENLMGCICFTLQLYCDFSGYSDMAIGIALLLGFQFKDNFNAPFKAQNPSDFWRRWHISLSSWLRDYVYIPLGGNRKGRARTYVNNFLSMLIGGLWHGASWMYVLWGAYHGLLLAVHKLLKQVWRLPAKLKSLPITKFVNIFITFALVVVGFTFFRADSLDKVGEICHQLFHAYHVEVLPQFVESYALIVALAVLGFAAHFAPKSWSESLIGLYQKTPLVVQAIVLALVLFAVIQMRQSEIVPFVYLQY